MFMKGLLSKYKTVDFRQVSRVLLLLIMLVCPLLLGFSTGEFLHVRGWVISNERPLANAILTIYENDSVVHRQRTGLRGTFYYNVPFNKEYVFAFTRDDLVAKRLFFNTHTFGAHDPDRYYLFEFEVELIEDRTYIFADFFANPLATIFFDNIQNQFDHVRYCLDDYIIGTQIASRQSAGLRGQSPSFALSHTGGIVQLMRNLEILEANNFMQRPPSDLLANSEIVSQVSRAPDRTETVTRPEEPLARIEKTETTAKPDKPETRIVQDNISDHTDPEPDIHPITFFSLSDPGKEKTPGSSVFFSVQVLATKKYIPRGFFDVINREMADSEILFYHDTDNLDKYIMGVFEGMDETLEKFWKLRSLGYEAYIVAFKDDQRIRVSEARYALGK